MQAIKIKDNIYWVGAIDWDVMNFHGYTTHRGTTYNAYLIINKKITLIDTVKSPFYDEMISRISSIIEPEKIDYVISNHVEMDHSGALPKLMDIAKDAVLITSQKGQQGLKSHYKKDWNFMIVKSGDTLNIGSRDISFLLTPMLHWPDNMISYMAPDRVLFSNDAFGQHLASSKRFDDELPIQIIYEEAQKYYGNIVLPFGKQVEKALEAAACLDIDIIAPSHGVIWRKNHTEIIDMYKKWSENVTEDYAAIVYDSMWGSTEKIAYAIQSAFEENNVKTRLCNLKTNHISDIMAEVLIAKYICIGSPTLNNNVLPTVAGFMTYMKGLAPKNRVGMAFGSYGWGGQSISQVEAVLKECGFDMLESIKTEYIPDDTQLKGVAEIIEKYLKK